MEELTKKQKMVTFFKVNRSKIIKGTLLVTAVAAGVLATKYLQLRSANDILELTTSIPEETTGLVEVVDEVIKDQL